jgi:hypothetical protein
MFYLDYWGVADIQAALLAIADWVKQISWDGPAAAIDELIVVGHSNGGMKRLNGLTDCSVDC